MSSRYGRARPARGTRYEDRGDRSSYYHDKRYEDRGPAHEDRAPRRGRDQSRGNRREETPPRRRRERRGSTSLHSSTRGGARGAGLSGDPTAVINQIIRKLERDDRRERSRIAIQIQEFAQDPVNKQVLESKCEALLTLLDPMIEDAVERENDYNLPRTIASIGLGLGSRCNDLINWLTNKLMSPNTSPQVTGFLLNITKHLADKNSSLSTGVLPLIDTLIQLLERFDIPQMIIILLDALVPLTLGYTRFFAPHFTNIIDLLIGWHIESDTNSDLQKSIAKAFLAFQPFWASDISYPLSLIMQFVQDAQRIQTELCTPGNNIDKESVQQFVSLVKVFAALLSALEEITTVSPNVPDFLSKLVCQIIDSSSALLCIHASYPVVSVIANATPTITKCLPSHFGLICVDLVCFLIDCISPLDTIPAPDTTVLDCLQAILYITDQGSNWLGTSVLNSILAPSSPIVSLRNSKNEKVLAVLFRIYQSLLQLQNFKLLDIVYQFIVQDLHIAIEKIFKCIEEKTDLKEAETLASANLSLLTEMAGSKSHGFSTWALNPTIFDLVTSVHTPQNWALARHCPSVHYAILNVLHAECKRHGYFLPGAGTSEVVQLQPHNTSQQLCRVLKLLSILLPHPSLSFDSRYFCLLWVKRVVEIMKKAGESSESMKFCHAELQDLSIALVKIADDPERDVRLEVAGCLRLLLLAQLLSEETQIHCLAVAVLHMGDVDGATRGAFVGVLEALSPNLILGYEMNRLNLDKYAMRPLLQSRHLLQVNTEVGLVTSNQFTTLMRLILLNQIPGKFIHDDWLERLFYTCNSNTQSKFNFINGSTSPCDSSLWFWFMWNMALYSVNSRLKTPLGKATETFECIEGILHELLEDSTIPEDTNNLRGIISGIGSQCYVSLLRSNLLLHFINNLEKLIYNAYEGTVHSIQGCTKSVKSFFVLNRNTCLDWFTRIRPAIAMVCCNTGMHAESWRHTLHIPPSSSAMLLALRAALNMHAPGYIRGLRSVYPKHGALLDAAELQACGRFEEAGEAYKSTIETITNTEEKQFVAIQALECYHALSDWDETLDWIESYNNDIFTDKTSYDKNYLLALNAFDLGDFDSVASHLEMVPGAGISRITDELSRKNGIRTNNISLEFDVPSLADPEKLLYLSQLQLLRVCGLYHNVGDMQLIGGDLRSETGSYSSDMDRPESSVEKGPEFVFRKLLRQASSLVEVGVRIAGIDLPVLMPGRTAVQLQCVSALHQLLLCDSVKAPTGVPLNLSHEEMYLDHNVHETGSWMHLYRYAHHLYQYFEPCQEGSKNMLTSQMVLNLGVSVARLARKQGNVRLSQRLLISELTWHGSGVHPSRPPLTTPVLYISDHVTSPDSPDSRSTLHTRLSKSLAQYIPVDLLPLHTQSAKVMYQCGSQAEAIEALSAAVLYKQRNPATSRNSKTNEAVMKCVLTLGKWLSRDSSLGLMAMSPTFPCLQTLLDTEQRSTAHSSIRLRDGVAVSEVEYLEGRLLRYVAEEANDMANAWHALGTWAYNISKRAVDQIQLSRETILPEERALVEELAGKDCDAVWNLMLGAAVSQTVEGLDKRIAGVAGDLSEEVIVQICEVFNTVNTRLYHNYRIAVKSYCRYLHLSAGERDCTTRPDTINKTTHRELQTTLRLLRLMTSLDGPLSDLVQDISKAPALQWFKVTPQLLARIGHSNQTVRSALLTILCSVARQYPHRLVYNCVEKCCPSLTVDSDHNKSDLADMIENIDLEEEEESNNGQTPENDRNITTQHSELVDEGYQAIYATLTQHSAEIVSDVQVIVHELRRINLLRAELWAGVLGHRYTDITRKFNQLGAEFKRVNSNMTLSYEEKQNIAAAKQQALLKPLMVMLTRVIKITTRPGETKYEVEFQEQFGEKIEEAMRHLETCVDLKNPARCWSKFEELHHELQDHIKANLMHTLADISPKLANLSNLNTPLPGTHHDYRASGYVTIDSFHKEVHVLPTKTKPKKIGILGSNGRKYTYLFKGLEDLRLDERVMQLLGVCNVMLSSKGCKQYTVTQYSVTPLGPRSGLIQWVGSGSPLFSLYKRWQQRESLKNCPEQPPAVLNCSEIFHSKVNAVMSKMNLNEKLPRSEWPAEVLLEVLRQLTNETPADLLSKELWCSSTSPTHWWNTVQRFTHSSAAMSIIGFVIGLGDRHLDNILVDFQKGDIVHIDYNVCFEKGKGLRVPERVPCRLTPNITQAFGPAGVEGTFRMACEKIMSVLRLNREVILALLDAFVYDPLIEWTSANDEGVFAEVVKDVNSASRKELEINSLYSLLSCRVMEMNVPLKNNKQAFTGAMNAISKSLTTFSDHLAKLPPHDVRTKDIVSRQRLLCDVKGDKEHSLWQLQERYEAQAAHNSSHAALNGKLVSAAEQYKTQQDKFQAILEFIEGNVLETLISRLNAMSETEPSPSYLPALEFLKSSGQTELVSQSEQIDSDINLALAARRNATITTVRALKPYGSIVSYFQRHFVTQHPGSFWADWLERLALQPSATHCDDICAQCELAALKIRTLPSDKARKVESFIQDHTNGLKMKLSASLEQQSKIPARTDVEELEDKVLKQDNIFICQAVSRNLLDTTGTWVTMERLVFDNSGSLGSLNTVTGQWFLDEFVSSSKLAATQMELLCKLDTPVEPNEDVIKAGTQTALFIEDLAQVYNMFSTIVLHETLKTLHTGNQDVLSCVFEYLQILETALQDGLTDDVTDLYTAMGDSTKLPCSEKIREIRESVKIYQDRIRIDFHTKDQTASNYKGCLLIMCLESLLTKTIEAMLSLADCYRNVLGKVAQFDCFEEIRESSSLRYLNLELWESDDLYGILYVTLMQAINAYLQRCFLHVQLFDRTSDTAMASCEDDTFIWSSTEELLHPVRQFLGVVLQIGGIGYFPGLLCHVISSNTDITADSTVGKISDIEVSVGGDDPAAVRALSSWMTGWHISDTTRRLTTSTKNLKSSLQRSQLELIAFQWLHELSQVAVVPRTAFIADLTSKLEVLRNLDSKIRDLEKLYETVEGKIRSRLTWAAGANPTTREVLGKFEAAAETRISGLEQEDKYTRDVMEMCGSVIELEVQRLMDEERKGEHEALLTLLRKFAESTGIVEEYSKELAESTHLIHKLAAPDKGMTVEWIDHELKNSGKQLTNALSKQKQLQAEVRKASDLLLSDVEKTKEQAGLFVKLVGDVAEHLSSLAQKESGTSHGARTLLKSHQKLVSDLKTVLSNIKEVANKSKKDQGDSAMFENWVAKTPETVVELLNIRGLIEWIFNQLDSYGAGSQQVMDPPPDISIGPTSRTKTRLLKSPEKNQYALNVLKRVRSKLEGRDGGVVLSVTDQVGSVINTATSTHNLSLMYEGWTPWV